MSGTVKCEAIGIDSTLDGGIHGGLRLTGYLTADFISQRQYEK